ncbi:transketolase [Selenomonas sp. oral taxon 126]|uniref:transketolase n=1 Tax=Selenomonas sp. oral taxon 126 TaxID=712528 RepID=UPI001F3001C0|nr:transketolase [Selenomonas sp. oral taxon 126]
MALELAYRCGTSSHLGGGLSMMEILSVLYGVVMNTAQHSVPYEAQDKFVLSKGHGVLGLYTALAEFGIITQEQLATFQQDGSDLIAHPVMNASLGIESSSGSLGQGISMGVGLALAAKKKGYAYRTFVLCGNGESNEGSVWEAAMSAVQFGLDNFTLVIDNNHMQSDGASEAILDLSDRYGAMLRAVGFETIEVDGHDVAALIDAFQSVRVEWKPRAVVAHTVKGKGVSFMENNNDWHHNRLTEEQYQRAITEVEEA